VDVYVQNLENQAPRDALARLRTMNDQLELAQEYYAGTHRAYLIQFFVDQFRAPIAALEEEITTLRLEPAYITSQLQTASSKQEFIQRMRMMLVSQLVSHGFDGFVQRPFAGKNYSGIVTTDASSKVYVTSPLSGMDVLERYLSDAYARVELGETITTALEIPPRLYHSRKGNVYLFKNTEDLQAL
jgi:hypothetical protein